MKRDKKSEILNLQAGQHWKTEKNDFQIVRVGRLLAQYRFLSNRKKMTSIKVEQLSVIQDYINQNNGVLA